MTGKFNETKKALIEAMELAVPEATISGNWRQTIGHLVENLPFVTVRLQHLPLEDVYDRNIGEASDGSIATYRFSAHVFHSNCMEDGEEKGKYAQDVADRIESYLIKNVPVGYDIFGVGVRESGGDSAGSRISRVVVEGSINVLRVD
jgi:hypothetical protein